MHDIIDLYRLTTEALVLCDVIMMLQTSDFVSRLDWSVGRAFMVHGMSEQKPKTLPHIIYSSTKTIIIIFRLYL
jgi:hypothetical protein